MGESRVSRRSLLQLTVASLVGGSLAGCSGDDDPTAQSSTTSTTDPTSSTGPTATVEGSDAADIGLVHAALADEQRLLSVIAAARAAHPPLKAALDPRIRIQNAHIDALRNSLAEAPSQPPSTTPRLPRKPAALDRFLTRQLHLTARRRSADCLAATSGPLAQLMASMAASHTVGAAAWEESR